jgi:hypothetical protein
MKNEERCIKNNIMCATPDINPQRCQLCINQAYYIPYKFKKPLMPRNNNKKSRRLGSTFEAKNHENNTKILTSSNMTPNSGAGRIKGDEQITGLLRTMEELKTQVVPRESRGSKTFTIRKEWFEKLDREAPLENMEFWYLKFRFLEDDKDTYFAMNEEILMAMVKTLIEDRKTAKTAQNMVDLANAKADRIHAENILLEARIKELELENKLLKSKEQVS